MNDEVSKKIETFFSKYNHRQYKKGEILIRADDNPSGVFYLKSGTVKKYAISQKGEELVVNMFKPISFFPMSWAIDEIPNKFFYEAVSDLDTWRAPKNNVMDFLNNNPDVMFDLLGRLYRGIEGLLMKMTYLMSGNAYNRLIIELIIYAKRFGHADNGAMVVTVSEKDLAAQSGMTRETVSREMKRLKDKGFITFEKNILTITDLARLERAVAEGV